MRSRIQADLHAIRERSFILFSFLFFGILSDDCRNKGERVIVALVYIEEKKT